MSIPVGDSHVDTPIKKGSSRERRFSAGRKVMVRGVLIHDFLARMLQISFLVVWDGPKISPCRIIEGHGESPYSWEKTNQPKTTIDFAGVGSCVWNHQDITLHRWFATHAYRDHIGQKRSHQTTRPRRQLLGAHASAVGF